MAKKKDSSESRSVESRTLGAQDALARARLMSKSLRTPTERRLMAEANMKEQAKRGRQSEAPATASDSSSKRRVSHMAANMLDRKRQEDILSKEGSGLSPASRRRKRSGY